MTKTKKTLEVAAIYLAIAFLLSTLGLVDDLNSRFSPANMAFAAQTSHEEKDPFEVEEQHIADPLESVNRAFFHFNDKLYFWVLKPTAKVYAAFVPEGIRIGIRNAYENFLVPVRVVNNSLQGKFPEAGGEIARFMINSTLGFIGMVDVANRDFGLAPQDEDLGQTLGVWGLRPIIYFNWPFLGPSSLRDTIGTAGDSFLNPLFWIAPDELAVSAGVRAGVMLNNTSLLIGEYEDLKKSALDPYVAVRDAYLQNRAKKIKE